MNDMTWLWRVLVGGVVTITIGMSGWTLNAVANMPKEYSSKEELVRLRTENREDHKEILKEIRELHRGN